MGAAGRSVPAVEVLLQERGPGMTTDDNIEKIFQKSSAAYQKAHNEALSVSRPVPHGRVAMWLSVGHAWRKLANDYSSAADNRFWEKNQKLMEENKALRTQLGMVDKD